MDTSTAALFLALIAAFSSIGTAIGVPYVTARQRRAEKQEDYRREDQVADRVQEAAEQAAEAARLLVDRQRATETAVGKVAVQAEEAAKLLVSANELVTQTSEVTNGKLDVIHGLANSQMTTSIRSERDAVVRELAMMNEVLDLKRASGKEPSPETLAAIKLTQLRIDELEHTLVEREKRQAAIDRLLSDRK